jgi:hypothetical protein
MKIPIITLGILLPTLAFAQTAAPTVGNKVTNGGFETFTPLDNLWDGVNNDGFLQGNTGSATALREDGSFGDIPMPLSVQAGDINGDELIDLLTLDPNGNFRAYFNSGSKTEPKFTNAEILPLYLSRGPGLMWGNNYRQGMKVAMADMDGNGTQDMVLGTFAGEILFTRNTGRPGFPAFTQPRDVAQLLVSTSRDNVLWGNHFAPALHDVDRDGKLDLLVGEGGYSANAVHLLLNQGGGGAPRFNEDQRFFLAYGDGKEVLTPTVVDYNGDGNPDLIVGDRRGTLNLYLSEGPWQRLPSRGMGAPPEGSEWKFKSTISLGTVNNFGSSVTPATADLNGDGKFDILIGRPNGRIGLSYNRGTATAPQFAAPVEIRGVDVWKNTTMSNIGDWTTDFGSRKGNLYGYITTVTAEQDPNLGQIEGKYALKAGYFPTQNKILPFSYFPVPPGPGIKKDFGDEYGTGVGAEGWYFWNAYFASYDWESNMLVLRQELKDLKPGVNYEFSFRSKGRAVIKADWSVHCMAFAMRSEAKVVTRDARGTGNVVRNNISDRDLKTETFPVLGSWNNVKRPLKFQFKEQKDLNDPNKNIGASLPKYTSFIEIRALLTPGQGEIYLDDIQITEK